MTNIIDHDPNHDPIAEALFAQGWRGYRATELLPDEQAYDMNDRRLVTINVNADFWDHEMLIDPKNRPFKPGTIARIKVNIEVKNAIFMEDEYWKTQDDSCFEPSQVEILRIISHPDGANFYTVKKIREAQHKIKSSKLGSRSTV